MPTVPQSHFHPPHQRQQEYHPSSPPYQKQRNFNQSSPQRGSYKGNYYQPKSPDHQHHGYGMRNTKPKR